MTDSMSCAPRAGQLQHMQMWLCSLIQKGDTNPVRFPCAAQVVRRGAGSPHPLQAWRTSLLNLIGTGFWFCGPPRSLSQPDLRTTVLASLVQVRP